MGRTWFSTISVESVVPPARTTLPAVSTRLPARPALRARGGGVSRGDRARLPPPARAGPHEAPGRAHRRLVGAHRLLRALHVRLVGAHGGGEGLRGGAELVVLLAGDQLPLDHVPLTR